MSSSKHNTFKTPQKTAGRIQRSPPIKFNHFRSPLTNIQMSSVASSSHYTTGSPMRFMPQNHCTPPQPFFKIRNPFEKTLIDHLHTPICSPGMFKIRESSGSFKWDIEHVSLLKPADIIPCNSQFDPTPDHELERKATEAIEKFFSQEMIVPSPLNEVPKQTNLLPMDPPGEHGTTSQEGMKSTSREIWTQTILTFPAELPPEVEDTLKHFYTFSKEQNGIGEADISANASLRRKLCFEEVFSDGEEEHHTSFHNLSCPTFHSPHVNALVRGMKRNFDTPVSRTSIAKRSDDHNIARPNATLSAEDLHHELCEFSPVLEEGSAPRVQKNYYSGEGTCMRSPSLSPIRKSPEDNKSKKLLQKISPEKLENLHHSYDASPFSQSTPEKSSCTSKSSAKSSPDVISDSDNDIKNMNLKKVCCNGCQVDENEIICRSKFELSDPNLGRSRSSMKLDFNMDLSSDISMNVSGDQSLRCHSVMGDSDSNSSKQASGNYWDVEMAQFVMKNKNPVPDSCRKCEGDVTTVDANYEKLNFSDCKSAIDYQNERLGDIIQYLTPTKNKSVPQRCSRRCDDSSSASKPSPVRMSLDNSFNLDTDQYNIIKQPNLESVDITNFVECDHSNLVNKLSLSLPKAGAENKTNLYQIDSGFNDIFLNKNNILSSSNVTVCNSTKHADVTKSFISHTEASSVSWKRFDSGFNEETSSDCTHQMSCNENSNKVPRKYSPIVEYSENKENIYFEEFHKIIDRGQNIQDSMSISELFAEDMVSFNCNFSSTPSKSLYQNLK